MAGEWIAMRIDLADDEAVIGIACRLAIDVDLVVGKLHRLWAWANEQLSDGHTRVTMKWINDRLGCEGFAEAMAAEGWLAVSQKGGLTFPNFERWNLASAKRRLQDTRRKSKTRKTKPIPSSCGQMSASEADKNVTTEQNRTIQNNNNPPSPPEGPGEQPGEPEEERTLSSRRVDLSQALILPPLVTEAMRAYTPAVQSDAWEVAQAFFAYCPRTRGTKTQGEVAAVFANSLLQRPDAKQRLLQYFAVTDPKAIETEFAANQRLRPAASPYEICEHLFPAVKAHTGPTGPTRCDALEREKQKIAEAKANPVTPEQFAELRKKALARRPA
jgi:hypothetical protein